MTDIELVLAVQNGDEAALETLYRRHLPSVWRYAYAQLAGDLHAAEDVVGETFLAAVREIGRLRPTGGSFGGWLIGIARHKIGTHRRRRRRGDVALGPQDEPADPADASAPAAPLEAGELRRAVGAVMDVLPDDQRQTLEWKYVDGLSVREIAHRLDRTEKAVEATLYRARNGFREAFERADRAPR